MTHPARERCLEPSWPSMTAHGFKEIGWDFRGESLALVRFNTALNAAARGRAMATFCGEPGSGKEHAARELIRRSPSPGAPLLVLDCASLDPEHAEQEIFGTRLANVGSEFGPYRGMLEQASSGVLYLDEIVALPPEVQSRIARFLDTGEFRRQGEAMVRRSGARIVAGTRADPDDLARRGALRPELYFRLAPAIIPVPPVRAYLDDLPSIVPELAEMIADECKLHSRRFTPAALRFLRRHEYPGNLRELAAVVEHSLQMAGVDDVAPYHAPSSLREAILARERGARALSERVAEFKARIILDALALSGGNKQRAARSLGITRQHLHYLLREQMLAAQRRERELAAEAV
jgi:sigma-54-dependent transcriptional regulator